MSRNRNLANILSKSTDVATDSELGLVHINTTTITSAASFSINNVFDSTYDNYKIIGKLSNTTDVSVDFRLRANGSDLADNDYVAGYLLVGAGVSVALTSSNNVAATYVRFANVGASPGGFSIDLISPALNERTNFLSLATGRVAIWQNCHIIDTFQADGFSILTNGSYSGIVSVYGYRKS